MALLHATCVALDGVGVVLRGPSGAGKSDLALRLIDEGATLVADDYCDLGLVNGTLTATVPSTIAGKMEVRGIGIVDLSSLKSADVVLVVDLMAAADIPRLPDITTCVIEGVTVPWVCIDPGTPSASARVRLAVKLATQARAKATP